MFDVYVHVHVPCLFFIRDIHSSNDTKFRESLERYVSEHEHGLAACQIYGNHVEKEEMVSETFGETTFWRFDWYEYRDKTTREEKILGVRSRTLFARGYEAINNYIKNGDNLQNSHEAIAFAALKRFCFKREEHEKSLQKLSYKTSEAHVASVVSHHLLSQLLPDPSNYFVDGYYTNGESIVCCPCGCGEPINFGSTPTGSPNLFYGFADVVLLPSKRNQYTETDYNTSAVFSVKKKTNEMYSHRLAYQDLMYPSSDSNEEDGISSEEHISETDICDEKWLCKQAIAVSFCMYRDFLNNDNMRNCLSNCVPAVPVCAITNDAYQFAVYHPELDCLLKTTEPLRLFDEDYHFLKFSAIVDLWLMIYHRLYFNQPSPSIADQLRGTANLIPQLGEKRFENVVRSSHWLFFPHLRQNPFSRVPKLVFYD